MGHWGTQALHRFPDFGPLCGRTVQIIPQQGYDRLLKWIQDTRGCLDRQLLTDRAKNVANYPVLDREDIAVARNAWRIH